MTGVPGEVKILVVSEIVEGRTWPEMRIVPRWCGVVGQHNIQGRQNVQFKVLCKNIREIRSILCDIDTDRVRFG